MAEVTTKVDSPYTASGVQFAWDSTSLGSALACPMQYHLRSQGWQPKNPNVAIALAFGILIHAGIEHFHKQRALGASFDDAVHRALEHVMSKTDFREPTVSLYSQLPVEEDIEEQKASTDEDDDGINLRNSKVRTRYHLMRALVWYFEQYRQEAMPVVILPNGKPAVEYSFRVPTGVHLSDGTELIYSGHFDALVEFNHQILVRDIKTTKSITRQWSAGFDLSHQMTGYILGGTIGLERPVAGACIDAVCLQIGGVKFSRSFTYRSKTQLAEFIQLLGYVSDQVERFTAEDYWPMNTSACMFCEFKPHCSQPPELRSGYLNYQFERKEAWNPLKSR
jgi:hypothetical protein